MLSGYQLALGRETLFHFTLPRFLVIYKLELLQKTYIPFTSLIACITYCIESSCLHMLPMVLQSDPRALLLVDSPSALFSCRDGTILVHVCPET
jgi:hypothetical protein